MEGNKFMHIEKRIGKIQQISFGFGGYQDAQIGLSVTLGSDKEAWGVGSFKGSWGPMIKWSATCRWTEADRQNQYGEVVTFIGQLLTQANKTEIHQLKDAPVEVEFEGNALKSWRILTEAI